MRTRLLACASPCPMGYALADNVHACAADETVYFLDIGRDRYCRAGPSASRALLEPSGSSAVTGDASLHALVSAGLLKRDEGALQRVALCSHALPARDVHTHLPARPSIRIADVAEVAVLAIATATRLRRGGFSVALDHARRTGPKNPDRVIAIELLAQEIARFQCARSLLPASPRCLLDSLILRRWTARRGIPTELVIGIRPLPFAAHCWVEHDGIALNGSQDGIANFVPICVV